MSYGTESGSTGCERQVPNRKAVAPFSPGLPLRLPWVGNGLRPYRNAVAPFLTRRRNDATALRLDNHFHS